MHGFQCNMTGWGNFVVGRNGVYWERRVYPNGLLINNWIAFKTVIIIVSHSCIKGFEFFEYRKNLYMYIFFNYDGEFSRF